MYYRVNTRARVLDGVDGVVSDDRHAGKLLKEEDDDDEHEGLPNLGPPQLSPVRPGHALLLRRPLRLEQRFFEALELGIFLRQEAVPGCSRTLAPEPLQGLVSLREPTFDRRENRRSSSC